MRDPQAQARRDWAIEIHVHRDCSPEYAEWEAWTDDGTGDAEWFGRGTAPTAGACLDAAQRCLDELERDSRG